MRYNKDKIIAIVITITFLFALFTIFVSSNDIPHTSAKSAVLYEPKTKCFLYEKNENERLPMASTTKIMTALIALERLDLNEAIVVDPRATGIEGSSIYLEPEEELTAESLIYATMLASANDAAAALAYHICGGIESFSALMNEKAKELSLNNTSFTNPHGLDSPDHYTSAHDLAIIAAKALEIPKFREITSTKSIKIESSLKTRTLTNHNKLLGSYDGCVGVKTGYTKKSGRSLVSAAVRDNLTLISVTINAPDDWRDHEKLLDYGYDRLEARELIGLDEFSMKIPVINGSADTIQVKNKETLTYICEKDKPQFSKEILLDRYLIAPIKSGQSVGKIIFKENGKIIAETDIVATEDIDNKTKNRLFDFIN